MTTTTQYTLNTFGSPGLCSGDAAKAVAFYTGLFGWQADTTTTPGGSYTMFKLDGDVVAGMYQMADDRKQAGVKPHWNSYLLVENVAKTAKKAKELGGKILTEPFDAMGDVMANLQDPTGAKFSVWEARTEPDPVRLFEPGALCWSELYSHETDRAKEFYTNLFNWKAEPFAGGPMPYTVFVPEGKEMGIGGMPEMCEQMKDVPAQWLPYFHVTDADATAAKAKELGAKVEGPWDIPTVGKIVMMFDPEGARIAAIHPMPCQK